MKKKIAVFSMTLLMGGLLYFTNIGIGTAHDTGAPAGYTNSPHDGRSCDKSSCHNTHTLQLPMPWISSNVPSSGYLPDSVYTITAKAVYIGDSSYGFEISPQTPSGSAIGTLIVTNSTTTQLLSSGGLQYITHTIYGYEGLDSLTWSFEWKAPSTLTDSAILYGAFNCGNGYRSAANTYVYPATLIIHENKTAGLNNILTHASSFSVFPNPAQKQVTVSYTLTQPGNVKVIIYGIEGRKISDLCNITSGYGEHSENLMLPTGIKSGMYFVQFSINNNQPVIQKIIIE